VARVSPKRLAAAVAVLLACAAQGPAAAGLRVEPPPPRADAPVDASEHAMLDAVRGVASGHGLACQPGAGILLACRAAQVTGRIYPEVRVERQGTGYQVSIERWQRGGEEAPAEACALARSLAAAIDQALHAPATHPLTGTRCSP
jgi:hypothetical protein